MSTPDYLEATYDMFLSSIAGEAAESTRFADWVREVETAGLFAFEARRQGPQGTSVDLERTTGQRHHVLNLSSYNYLGYATHPQVIEAAKAALDRYGLGAASSPVHGGTFALHAALEAELVDFLGPGRRGATLFSSGYGVNTGTISAVMRKHHHVVMDRSAHMSILEGAQLSRAKLEYFQHNDPADLEAVLQRLSGTTNRILVCTEGVFSADGDFGALADIVGIAKRYGALVLVDEAHSFLVAGEGGRGVCEAAGVLDDVDLYVLTFSKALGGVGGALVASPDLARYIGWYARCRMFSCALDPAVTGGVLEALRLGRGADGDARRARIHANAAHLRGRLSPHVDLGPSESWIVPVVYGEESLTLPLVDYAQRHGLDGSVLQFPAVGIGESRMRLFASSEHTTAELDRAADILIGAAHELGFAL
ncbi:MAG: pyridoxal phosphate-dependent aminotransferase family protein [Myxococcota bacterium]